nr:cysteine--1-D-myo-inosityl 2-amino-2-deoxy-alpha-D-glucopyranoside ligase [Brevibacterium sp. 50QC2O2]
MTICMLGRVRSWSKPSIPVLPTRGPAPTAYSTSARGPVTITGDGAPRLYVCGITPYDATHMGHAATYVAFDTLVRVWRDAGFDVTYVQNTTDIDDPLLERADDTGVDWRALADEQIELFRTDMEALRVIPPAHYIGAVESIPDVVAAVEDLVAKGAAYSLDNGDVYYRVDTEVRPPFGSESHLDHAQMMRFFAERGGDPETPGKENPLDALLWRSARPGEPSWPGASLGAGRPGWHIECAVIAGKYAGFPLTVQGGGSDLIFPHHEMCAAHATALTGTPFAEAYMHTGMVGLDGEKMSKSKGNLVLVSRLRAQGVDPAAIRLAILAHHYRCDWFWDEPLLASAQDRLDQWRAAARSNVPVAAAEVLADLRAALADDLDTPSALGVIDEWAAARGDGSSPAAADQLEIVHAVDALLGIDLLAD